MMDEDFRITEKVETLSAKDMTQEEIDQVNKDHQAFLDAIDTYQKKYGSMMTIQSLMGVALEKFIELNSDKGNGLVCESDLGRAMIQKFTIPDAVKH